MNIEIVINKYSIKNMKQNIEINKMSIKFVLKKIYGHYFLNQIKFQLCS